MFKESYGEETAGGSGTIHVLTAPDDLAKFSWRPEDHDRNSIWRKGVADRASSEELGPIHLEAIKRISIICLVWPK